MTFSDIVSYNRPYTVNEILDIARDFYDRYVDVTVIVFEDGTYTWEAGDNDEVLEGEDKFYIEDINDDDYWDIKISASPVI